MKMWKYPKLAISFKWFDLWIGFYWDRKAKILYFCPVPMVVISLAFVEVASQCTDEKNSLS